jgi:phytanoyl-CoA hydroxylase
MLNVDQVKQFDDYGFLKGDVVLSDEEVETLRLELDMVMEGKTVKKPVLDRNMLDNSHYGMSITNKETVVQIVNIWMASDVFLQHAGNPRICEEVAQLCRTDTLRIWHDQIQYKPPVVGGPTAWHQDHPLWPVLQPADLVSAWVALDDATVENGCMWMVPGSHKWGNQQAHLSSSKPDFMPVHKQPELLPEGAKVDAVPFEIKKGQVGFHHSLTWHGSPHNRSDKKRRAIAVHYMPGHIYFAPNGSHPMEPHIKVKHGEIVAGDSFPVVYSKSH